MERPRDNPLAMNIVAVVITYHPELDALAALLNALTPQVSTVVVVDNGSDKSVRDWLDQHYSHGVVHGLFLGTNTGVASAQNAGIAWARRQGADHVVLFDQDSLPAPDMILHLSQAIQQKEKEGHKIGAAGPRYVDERNKDRAAFSRIDGLSLKKIRCDDESEQIVSSDFVISSGALISLATLEKVGEMAECLFIDQVDIEWGLRAKSLGYQSYGVCAAVMRHSLGETPISFMGRKVLHHGPLRHYYILRNAVWLLFRPYIPLGWKWLFVRTIFLRFGFYTLTVAPRLEHLRMMSLGIWHGLRGRMGPYKRTATE